MFTIYQSNCFTHKLAPILVQNETDSSQIKFTYDMCLKIKRNIFSVKLMIVGWCKLVKEERGTALKRVSQSGLANNIEIASPWELNSQ